MVLHAVNTCVILYRIFILYCLGGNVIDETDPSTTKKVFCHHDFCFSEKMVTNCKVAPIKVFYCWKIIPNGKFCNQRY